MKTGYLNKMIKGTVDSQYIQQHLANERTYLAWIRTSVAIVGIGFLAASLHFNYVEKTAFLSDVIAVIISIISFVFGIGIIIGATISYFRNRNHINNQTFRSSSAIIIYMSGLFLLVIFILVVYFFFL